jgi:transmembrane sensor
MMELEQLIQKFWASQTTLTENNRLFQLLEQYKGIYKDFLQDEFDVKENYLTPRLQPDRALYLLQKIHENLGLDPLALKQKARIISLQRLVRRVAIAASLCIIVGSALLYTGRGKENKLVVRHSAPSLPRLMQKINGPDSLLSFTLKDGSNVQLGKNSSLSWYEPFINDRRDISLLGFALFKVAKDKSKPFTVYAGGIATRALGTRFSVNASDTKKVMVRLLEGRVVVNVASGSGMTMKNVYLTPGHEFSFNKISRSYLVNTTVNPPGKAVRANLPDNKPELVFSKEPLGSVFKRVGILYKIHLAYGKEDMDGLYFTGTFLKSDDLNIVLSAICNVNDLLFTKKQDSIIITRSN